MENGVEVKKKSQCIFTRKFALWFCDYSGVKHAIRIALGVTDDFYDAIQSIFDIIISHHFQAPKKKFYFVQRKKLTTDFICHSLTALCKSIIRIERFHWIALTKLFYLASKILILNSKHQKNIEKSFPMLFNSLQKWNTNVCICVCFFARQFMDPFEFSTLCSTP